MASDKEKEPRNWKRSVLLYVHDLMCMLLAVMLLFLVVFRVILVTGDSMFSTLWDGDYLLLESRMFCGEPEPGDIVVISKASFDNGSPIVKRVIATEGQTVDIDFDAGVVYVDGEVLEEPYTREPTWLDEGLEFPVTVPEGCVFVMGDNRNNSKDSRYADLGPIDTRHILGRAVFLIWPGESAELGTREWSRIGGLKG